MPGCGPRPWNAHDQPHTKSETRNHKNLLCLDQRNGTGTSTKASQWAQERAQHPARPSRTNTTTLLRSRETVVVHPSTPAAGQLAWFILGAALNHTSVSFQRSQWPWSCTVLTADASGTNTGHMQGVQAQRTSLEWWWWEKPNKNSFLLSRDPLLRPSERTTALQHCSGPPSRRAPDFACTSQSDYVLCLGEGLVAIQCNSYFRAN